MLSQKQKIILLMLTIISISLFLFSVALETGYEHPIQTSDSKGNVLGFNNPITWELYGILLKSASPISVLRYLGFYGGIYVLLHFIALAFFWINPKIKARRSLAVGFFVQALVFPIGWIGVLALPFLIHDFFTGKLDGESLSDFPMTWILQSLWLVVSIAAGILIWRSAKKIQTAGAN